MLRPKVISVQTLPDYFLKVGFDNGEMGIFDVKPYIKGNWFGELKDEVVFRSAFINGNTVEWANGQDICPDELYYGSQREDRSTVDKASCVAEEASEYNA